MEILDYSFVPKIIRNSVCRSLTLTQCLGGLSHILSSVVLPELLKLNSSIVFELGSGSGANLAALARAMSLKKYVKKKLRFVLSDKFPQRDQWQLILARETTIASIDHSFCFEQVTRLPTQGHEGNIFLLISSSHHMDDDLFINFLRHSARLRSHVVIIEPLERKFLHAMLAVISSIAGLLTPFSRKLSRAERWQQLLIYYSGLGLLIQSYDGAISTLRQRSYDEMLAASAGLPFELQQKNNLGRFRNYSLSIYRFIESR